MTWRFNFPLFLLSLLKLPTSAGLQPCVYPAFTQYSAVTARVQDFPRTRPSPILGTLCHHIEEPQAAEGVCSKLSSSSGPLLPLTGPPPSLSGVGHGSLKTPLTSGAIRMRPQGPSAARGLCVPCVWSGKPSPRARATLTGQSILLGKPRACTGTLRPNGRLSLSVLACEWTLTPVWRSGAFLLRKFPPLSGMFAPSIPTPPEPKHPSGSLHHLHVPGSCPPPLTPGHRSSSLVPEVPPSCSRIDQLFSAHLFPF